MNTSSLLLHLVRKDFSAFRAHLLLLWLVIAAAVLAPLHAQGAGTIMVIAAFILLFLVQALLIQLDPARGTEHFLTTRPVPKVALLGSKLMLFLLGGIAPIILGALIQLAFAKLDASLADYGWICVRSVLLYVGLAGLMALIASLTGNVPRFIGCVVGIAILLLIGMTVFSWDYSRRAGHFPVLEESVYTTRIYLSLLLCGATAYALVVFRYLRRNWETQVFVLAAGIVMAALCFKFWSVSLMPTRELPVVQTPQVEAIARDVKIQLKARSDSRNTRSINGVSFTDIPGVFTIENLHGNYFIAERRTRSTVSFPGKSKLPSSITSDPSERKKPGIPLRNVAVLLGLPANAELPAWSNEDRNLNAKIFTHLSAQIPEEIDAVPMAVESDFDIYEPAMVAELPLEVGSAFAKDGMRQELVDAQLSELDLRLKWRLTMTGDNDIYEGPGFSMTDYRLYVANPVRGQILVSQGEGSSRGGLNLAGIRAANCLVDLYLFDSKGMREPITQAWLKDAKIYVIHAKRVGTFTRMFEVAAAGKPAK